MNNIISGCCPHCNSDNIEYGNSEFYDDGMGYLCTCNDCDEEWEEIYALEFVGINAGGDFYEVEL